MRGSDRPQQELDDLRAHGQRLGLAFGHFLAWVSCEARMRAAKRIYFLSREGVWFARHYEMLRKRTSAGSRIPSAEYLPVSRRSTYLASFESVTSSTFEPMLAQYRDATVRAVLESVGWLPSVLMSAVTNDAWRPLIDLDARWLAPGTAECVLSSSLVMPWLEQHRAKQRAALLEYLQVRGIGSGEPVLVADIGWRGTIQDNLARLLPSSDFEGLYYHLQPYFVPQFPNTKKRGFVLGDAPASETLQRRLRFASPIEFAIASEGSTTLEYRQHQGKVVPVHRERGHEPLDVGTRTAFADALSDGMRQLTLDTKPDRELALTQTLGYLENPPQPLVRLFFSNPRDEEFGRGIVLVGEPRITPWQLVKALVSTTQRERFGRVLAESGWPWALLRRDLPLLAPLLQRVMLYTDARLSTSVNSRATPQR